MSAPSLVLPGQLIAVSREGQEETSFLRGHGTYMEKNSNNTETETRLLASVVGTVERVNKLISVLPVTIHTYQGHVGDLVVGRIVSVGLNRWKVQLVASQTTAVLPLSGVHLPVQRVRTQQDAREMRLLLKEGDLVSAEVHKVLPDGTWQLHTRSTRYGRLDNGTWTTVPPGLVRKRQNHYLTQLLDGQFDVLLGCNGWIWMQRASRHDPQALVEVQEAQRRVHAEQAYNLEERQALARLRNSVEILRLSASFVTVENLQHVYRASQSLSLQEMLQPEHVVQLTQSLRPTTTT